MCGRKDWKCGVIKSKWSLQCCSSLILLWKLNNADIKIQFRGLNVKVFLAVSAEPIKMLQCIFAQGLHFFRAEKKRKLLAQIEIIFNKAFRPLQVLGCVLCSVND